MDSAWSGIAAWQRNVYVQTVLQIWYFVVLSPGGEGMMGLMTQL